MRPSTLLTTLPRSKSGRSRSGQRPVGQDPHRPATLNSQPPPCRRNHRSHRIMARGSAVRRGSRCGGVWFQARTDPVVRSRDDQGSRGCGDLNSGSVTGHGLAAGIGDLVRSGQSRAGWAVARWVMALGSAVPAGRPGCWRACRLRVRLIGRTRLAVRPGRRSGGHCPPAIYPELPLTSLKLLD